MRLILASTSPRRRDLLALLNIPFEVRSPNFDERVKPGLSAAASVAAFARGKAQSIVHSVPEALVLGSDTVIELDGAVFGKPRDLNDARSMLRRLAGRGHLVHTAVALACHAQRIDLVRVSTAQVVMRPYSAEVHDRYLTTGDSLGKAGAYSIQGPGAILIERLDGDFPTVVGLPLRLTAALLNEVGLTGSVDVEVVYRAASYDNWARFQTPEKH